MIFKNQNIDQRKIRVVDQNVLNSDEICILMKKKIRTAFDSNAPVHHQRST